MNAGEDVLVFYNDNKASFQQFVEMMRNERDRQYREDMQIAATVYGSTAGTLAQDNQQSVDTEISGSTASDAAETTTAEEPMQKKAPLATTAESEYGENNGHGALRFVFSNDTCWILTKNCSLHDYQCKMKLDYLLL